MEKIWLVRLKNSSRSHSPFITVTIRALTKKEAVKKFILSNDEDIVEDISYAITGGVYYRCKPSLETQIAPFLYMRGCGCGVCNDSIEFSRLCGFQAHRKMVEDNADEIVNELLSIYVLFKCDEFVVGKIYM